jgi:hypothetical protein
MSQITDNVFAEVCLDERVSDGIFRMEEEQHMNALRDYFVKKGIPKEAAIHVTNRMIEGKYPERQAYRAEDGILVTWPSPQHMAKAFKENPGKYVTDNPNPPRPSEKEPVKEPIKREPPTDNDPEEKEDDAEEGDDDSLSKSSDDKSSLFDKEPSGDEKVGGLSVEPNRGNEKAEPIPMSPTNPTQSPRTPERIAAEKEIAMQLMGADDHALSKLDVNLQESKLTDVCRYQLNELYKKADECGYREAVTFLTPYIKP